MTKHIINTILLMFCICFELSSLKHLFKKVVVDKQHHTFKLIDTYHERNTVLVAINIHNSAYALPTFLKTLETLQCGNLQKKCDLYVNIEQSSDNSQQIFQYWLNHTNELFNSTVIIMNNKNFHFEAISYGLSKNFEYLFFLNPDTILIESNTIGILLNKKIDIIAPLLTSSEESKYSTFLEKKKFDSYYFQKSKGHFKVDGVQECFLMKLKSQYKKFFKQGASNITQIMIKENLPMYLNNVKMFGYITNKNAEFIESSFAFLRRKHLLSNPDGKYNKPLEVTEFLNESLMYKSPTKFGLDEIYVINLERRTDRKMMIESSLHDLNIAFKTVKAVDGLNLTEEYLNEINLKPIPNYLDPSENHRSVNFGEIGCFLSHYFIWKDVVEKKYEKILILEDDIRFLEKFNSILNYTLSELKEKKIEWDLTYLSRRTLYGCRWNKDFVPIYGHGLVKPGVTGWTNAYLLSLSGAKKLLESKPLEKILAVDMFLSLMFDKPHKNKWKKYYPKRDLIAYGIEPCIIYPTHYYDQKGHTTDTAESALPDFTKITHSNKEECQLREGCLSNFVTQNVHAEL